MADALREALKLHASSEANAAANRAMGSASECNELVNAVMQAQGDVEDTLDVACEARDEAQEARDEARDEAVCVEGLAAKVEEDAYKAQCHEENTARMLHDGTVRVDAAALEAKGSAESAAESAYEAGSCLRNCDDGVLKAAEHVYNAAEAVIEAKTAADKAGDHEYNTGRIAEATRAELAKAVAKTGADRDELAEELAVAKMNKRERQIHKATRAADAAMAEGSQKKLKAFF
jgi:hypothetical protein